MKKHATKASGGLKERLVTTKARELVLQYNNRKMQLIVLVSAAITLANASPSTDSKSASYGAPVVPKPATPCDNATPKPVVPTPKPVVPTPKPVVSILPVKPTSTPCDKATPKAKQPKAPKATPTPGKNYEDTIVQQKPVVAVPEKKKPLGYGATDELMPMYGASTTEPASILSSAETVGYSMLTIVLIAFGL
jgi:type IV secretory pathway VirB10-like protein